MPAHTPEECDKLFARYVNSGDVEGLLDLYEPDASFVQQDGAVARGTSAILDSLRALVEMRPAITVEVRKVIAAGDDLATIYDDWSMTGTAPDGSPVAISGKALEVVRRRTDGVWRFAIDDPFGRD